MYNFVNGMEHTLLGTEPLKLFWYKSKPFNDDNPLPKYVPIVPVSLLPDRPNNDNDESSPNDDGIDPRRQFDDNRRLVNDNS